MKNRLPISASLAASALCAPAFFRGSCLAVAITCLSITSAHAADVQGNLSDFGLPAPGATSVVAWGLSDDGSVAVGHYKDAAGAWHAYRWTGATGFELLPFKFALFTSADGKVVAGQLGNRAVRWEAATGITLLAPLAGQSWSDGLSVSADGQVVVGDSWNGVYNTAVRWVAGSTAAVSLGTLNGGTQSVAFNANRDGSVIVGWADDGAAGFGYRAFRWTSSTNTMQSLGTLPTPGAPSSAESYAYAVSRDGTIVTGYSSSANGYRAFRWAAGTHTMQDLGTVRNGSESYGYGMNADGSVIVGSTYVNGYEATRGFRWSQATGMQTIEDWLRSYGLVIPQDITSAAYATSADGLTIVGVLASNSMFIARAGAGMLDMDNYQASLARIAQVRSLAWRDADLVMHGAHGSPMRGLLGDGRTALWVAGDGGEYERSGDKARSSVGELGFARRLSGRFQFQAALGNTYASTPSNAMGDVRVRGIYVMPEAIWSFTPQLHATVSGYYNDSNAMTRRTYTNLGVPESVAGLSGVGTAALRLRLDWLNAFDAAGTGFTPYASITRSRSHADAYTETGGNFPATWDARTETATVARLGVDAVHAVSEGVNLLARLEAARRSGTSSAATGQVGTLFGFGFDAPAVQRSWARASIGADARLPIGTLSLALNGTTQSDTAKWWVAASLRKEF